MPIERFFVGKKNSSVFLVPVFVAMFYIECLFVDVYGYRRAGKREWRMGDLNQGEEQLKGIPEKGGTTCF